jgi:hypothetical protein
MKLALLLVYGGISGGKSCTCVVPALGSSGKHRILQQPLIVSSELSALGAVASPAYYQPLCRIKKALF